MSDSRKCEATSSGCRSNSTVMPPSGTCPTVAMAATSAPILVARVAPVAWNATMATSTTTTMIAPENMRFENSIHAWWLLAGTMPPALHRGQSLQPRPDPVRRTRPPLGKITHSRAIETSASQRKPRTDVSECHARRKGFTGRW